MQRIFSAGEHGKTMQRTFSAGEHGKTMQTIFSTKSYRVACTVYRTVPCGSVQFRTVHSNVPYISVPFRTVAHSPVHCYVVPYSIPLRFCTVLHVVRLLNEKVSFLDECIGEIHRSLCL